MKTALAEYAEKFRLHLQEFGHSYSEIPEHVMPHIKKQMDAGRNPIDVARHCATLKLFSNY